MRGRRAAIAALVVALVAVVGIVLFARRSSAKPLATIEVVKPAVQVEHAQAEAVPAKSGEEIGVGDQVITDDGGLATVSYFDGSLTRLGPGAKFTVEKLERGVARQVIARLDAGKSWHRVKASTASGSRFEIQTSNATAAVRGTSFTIECEGEDCVFGVRDGTVRITDAEGNVTVVEANQQVKVKKGKVGKVERLVLSEWILTNVDLDSQVDFDEPDETTSTSDAAAPDDGSTTSSTESSTTTSSTAPASSTPPATTAASGGGGSPSPAPSVTLPSPPPASPTSTAAPTTTTDAPTTTTTVETTTTLPPTTTTSSTTTTSTPPALTTTTSTTIPPTTTPTFIGGGPPVVVTAPPATTTTTAPAATTGGVQGKVASESDGTPVEGATISVSGPIDIEFFEWLIEDAMTTTSGEDGGYSISGLKPGHYLVEVVPPPAAGLLPGSDSVLIEAGVISQLDFVLSPATGAISGTVIAAATGDPVVDANVIACLNPGMDTCLETQTDTNGFYEIGPLAPGGYGVGVHASSTDNLVPETRTVTVVANEPTVADFALEPATTGSISGTVLHPDTSEGVADATVRACPTTIDVTCGQATSNTEGFYEIGNLAPDTYTVVASPPEIETTLRNSDAIEVGVTVGEISSGNDLTLNTPPTGGISGTVTDADTALAIQSVTVSACDGDVCEGAETNADGAYSIAGLTPAFYTVTALKTGYVTDSGGVLVSDLVETADFILSPTTGSSLVAPETRPRKVPVGYSRRTPPRAVVPERIEVADVDRVAAVLQRRVSPPISSPVSP